MHSPKPTLVWTIDAMNPLSSKMYVAFAFNLLVWIIMLQTDFLFISGCPDDERSSLLDFKAGLNVSSGRLSSWRGYNCCQWEGIACDYHTSHVIHLDLQNRHDDVDGHTLGGKIHPSLFNLQHLQHLDLSFNDFNGISIPPQLAKLKRLTFLSLSYAGFGGEVPAELGNMSSLRHMDISDKYPSLLVSRRFAVWVKNLQNLEYLAMDGVNLTMASEHWGDAVSRLSNLTQIHLGRCGISGIIPNLLNLTHLSHIHIDRNSFRFPLPNWFENVSSLVSLDLHMCHLRGSVPSNLLHRSRMRNIVLNDNHDLTANLSSILSHTSSLVELDLSNCNLEGAIRWIANFSKLQLLDLSYGNLNSSIPSSFVSLSSLRYLSLVGNNLPGQIPPSLGKLSVLSDLYLDHNQLSGTIPDNILNLVSLEVLSLGSNRLTGNISLSLFENLTKLQVLELSENQFTIEISTSWVPQFSYLETLSLRSCNIQGDFPAFLSQQYSLEQVDLSSNNIVGNFPNWLWDLPYLEKLNLSNNRLEGSLLLEIPPRFLSVDLHGNRLYGSLPALDFVSETLDLSYNQFNGSIPAANITPAFLSLSGNNLTGEIPSSIFTNPIELWVLDLSKNKLKGMIPANIGRGSRLLVLDLAQNFLQGEIPDELGNLGRLKTLNLNGNRLQGIIPSSFANCTELTVFDLGNNKFEGNIPVWIEKLTQLRILSLTDNRFEGSIPPQLMRLQNLQILDLSGNSLSGFIPQALKLLYEMVNQSQIGHDQFTEGVLYGEAEYKDGSFFVLSKVSQAYYVDQITIWIKGRASQYKKIIEADKFMDLSNNKLSGNIPVEMGHLKGLISLNISNNNLSGSIPESLAGMAHLESLDLSGNKLSGKIPAEMINLTFLSVLNVSHNMLSGFIPQGKQFSTFGASSFIGNPNLHGFPLENGTLSSSRGSRDSQREMNNTVVADGDGDGDEDEMDRWWAVAVGLCYGVGFATVIAVLCFHIEWRYRWFALLDSFIHYLFER